MGFTRRETLEPERPLKTWGSEKVSVRKLTEVPPRLVPEVLG